MNTEINVQCQMSIDREKEEIVLFYFTPNRPCDWYARDGYELVVGIIHELYKADMLEGKTPMEGITKIQIDKHGNCSVTWYSDSTGILHRQYKCQKIRTSLFKVFNTYEKWNEIQNKVGFISGIDFSKVDAPDEAPDDAPDE